VVDHPGCPGEGQLLAHGKGARLRNCPACGHEVTWQLTHLSATVAADHRGAGPLP
jgi:hypothetical protein